jgi:hypothetical protein
MSAATVAAERCWQGPKCPVPHLAGLVDDALDHLGVNPLHARLGVGEYGVIVHAGRRARLWRVGRHRLLLWRQRLHGACTEGGRRGLHRHVDTMHPILGHLQAPTSDMRQVDHLSGEGDCLRSLQMCCMTLQWTEEPQETHLQALQPRQAAACKPTSRRAAPSTPQRPHRYAAAVWRRNAPMRD